MATKFITVSIEIMHDDNLNQSQKFILAEIEQLSQLEKGCIASNQHFSELIGITKTNVSKNISDLCKKEYINITVIPGSRNHERVIKMTTPPCQNDKTPLSKRQETKENKTINIYIGDVERVIKYLNSKADTRFKQKSKVAERVIVARLKEEHTLEEFAHVIDVKVAEWKGTDMEKFLRPETLFGNKFDGYLQQKKVQSNKQTAEGVEYTW